MFVLYCGRAAARLNSGVRLLEVTMRPKVKLLIGILSHLPGIYMFCFMAFIIFMMTHEQMFNGHAHGPPTPVIILFVCHMLFMLLTFALLAFWIFWLVKSTSISQDTKIILSLGCFFAAPIVMPILYWAYLRKSPDGPHLFTP